MPLAAEAEERQKAVQQKEVEPGKEEGHKHDAF